MMATIGNCVVCDRPFRRKPTGRPRKYCSKLCTNIAWGRVGYHAFEGRTCRCGKPVPPGRWTVCSDACHGTKPKGNRILCKRCGVAPRAVIKNGNARYCEPCRVVAIAESSRQNHLRRRRSYRGVLHHSERDWIKLLHRFGGRCAYCEAPATDRDHVIPLSRGGHDGIGNILPACRRCNVQKYNLLLVEWLHGRPRQ